jgi:hypothetical protein
MERSCYGSSNGEFGYDLQPKPQFLKKRILSNDVEMGRKRVIPPRVGFMVYGGARKLPGRKSCCAPARTNAGYCKALVLGAHEWAEIAALPRANAQGYYQAQGSAGTRQRAATTYKAQELDPPSAPIQVQARKHPSGYRQGRKQVTSEQSHLNAQTRILACIPTAPETARSLPGQSATGDLSSYRYVTAPVLRQLSPTSFTNNFTHFILESTSS